MHESEGWGGNVTQPQTPHTRFTQHPTHTLKNPTWSLCTYIFVFLSFFHTIIPSLKAFCNFLSAEYRTHCVSLTQRTLRRRPAIDFPLTPSASARVTKSVFTGRDIAVKNRRGINIFLVLSSLSCAHQCFQRTEKLVIWLFHRQRRTLLIILLSRAAIPRLH